MRTSYSALETYKLCPQKFKFQEIDRIPSKKSKAAVFGTIIHGALKHMFSRDPIFPTLDEVLNSFSGQFSASAASFSGADAFSPEEYDLYLTDAMKMLKNFYASNAPWNFSVMDLESRFEVLLEDPRKKEMHMLAGRIDRIDKTGDGYEVMDYKTSRRMPSQADVDSNLQLSIYALGMARKWPHIKAADITLSLYFLKHGEKLSTKRSEADMQKTASDTLATISEIGDKLSSGGRFGPVPGPLCDFCGYRPICPAWRHLYRNRGGGGSAKPEEIDAAIKEYFEILKSKHGAEARLAELKSMIRAYMEAEGFDRVFGDEGYISRSVQKRFSYDLGKVRALLEPLGRWEEILKADDKKLAAVLKGLPADVGAEVEGARKLVREFTVLTASSKKIARPPEAGPLPDTTSGPAAS